MRALIKDAGLSHTWLQNTIDMLGRMSYMVDGEKLLKESEMASWSTLPWVVCAWFAQFVLVGSANCDVDSCQLAKNPATHDDAPNYDCHLTACALCAAGRAIRYHFVLRW